MLSTSGKDKGVFFVVVLREEIWFGEMRSNTLCLPGGRGCNRKNSSGKEGSIEGRKGLALFQLPKINMMAPVCGVTCLQRQFSYWIPDGYTAGPGVINLASCVESASMWQHFSTPQHNTPIKKKNIIAIRQSQTETRFSCHFFVVLTVFCNSKISSFDAIVSGLNVKPPAQT